MYMSHSEKGLTKHTVLSHVMSFTTASNEKTHRTGNNDHNDEPKQRQQQGTKSARWEE